MEEVQYKKVKFIVWDVGGRERITSLWKYYFNTVDAVVSIYSHTKSFRASVFLLSILTKRIENDLLIQIYVVDSLDRERIGTAKAEFQVTVTI